MSVTPRKVVGRTWSCGSPFARVRTNRSAEMESSGGKLGLQLGPIPLRLACVTFALDATG